MFSEQKENSERIDRIKMPKKQIGNYINKTLHTSFSFIKLFVRIL